MNPLEVFLLSTPQLGVMIFILVAVLSALTCYGVTRMLLRSRIGEDSEQLTARIIAPLGALHALILALIFTQEMADYRDVTRVVSKEASVISDVYFSLLAYDDENLQSTAAIRGSIVDYVKTVLEADRPALAEHHLSHQTFANYNRIKKQLTNLQTTNNSQEDLRVQMLSDWDTVSGLHMRLSSIARYEAPDFFWIVIVAGFIAVVIPFYVYSPKISNLVILSTFAAFNGLVTYVVFSIENPFTGPTAIDATILDDLLAIMGSAAS